jgi:hypothetical protein
MDGANDENNMAQVKVAYMIAIIVLHPFRTIMSKAIQIEIQPNKPMNIEPSIVNDKGGL